MSTGQREVQPVGLLVGKSSEIILSIRTVALASEDDVIKAATPTHRPLCQMENIILPRLIVERPQNCHLIYIENIEADWFTGRSHANHRPIEPSHSVGLDLPHERIITRSLN